MNPQIGILPVPDHPRHTEAPTTTPIKQEGQQRWSGQLNDKVNMEQRPGEGEETGGTPEGAQQTQKAVDILSQPDHMRRLYNTHSSLDNTSNDEAVLESQYKKLTHDGEEGYIFSQTASHSDVTQCSNRCFIVPPIHLKSISHSLSPNILTTTPSYFAGPTDVRAATRQPAQTTSHKKSTGETTDDTTHQRTADLNDTPTSQDFGGTPRSST